MSENINRVEAVLFSSGRKMSIEELKKVCKIKSDEEINLCIEELKKRHNNETSLMLIHDNDSWKMTVREKYLQYIKKIVTDTELSKTVMETLAVIAWKNPAIQSDVIKIRTNKAYDHINELHESGFIESSKYGRTRLIKLTKKFYDYFDLESDKDIKKIFGNVKHPKIPQTKVIDYDVDDSENQVQVVDLNDDYAKNINLEVYDEKDLKPLQQERVIIINDEIENNLEENNNENQKIEIIDEESDNKDILNENKEK
jgi:segregation and condensation protein B